MLECGAFVIILRMFEGILGPYSGLVCEFINLGGFGGLPPILIKI